MAVGGDPEDGSGWGGGGPQGAPLTGAKPARLVDIDSRGFQHRGNQPLVRLGERAARALADRVDRPDREPDREQLAGQLAHVAAGDTVARGHGHDRGLQLRAEGRSRNLRGQGGTRSAPAARAAQPMRAMLAHDHPDRRQLGQLMATRTLTGCTLVLAELVPAPLAALGVVIDDLIDPIFRQRLAARPPVAGLTARPAALSIRLKQRLRLRPRLRPPLLARLRRILRGRLGTRARAGTRPFLQPRHPRLQTGDLALVPRAQRKQKLDTRIPARVINPLRLAPFHAAHFGSHSKVPSRLKNIKPLSFAGRSANPPRLQSSAKIGTTERLRKTLHLQGFPIDRSP